MKKISIILGTRPEAIKLIPLILGFKDVPDIDVNICITGQHKKMLDQVFEHFDIVPDVDLQLMSHNQSLSEFTAKAINAIDSYLKDFEPDLVIAQGDTTSVFCSALVSFYQNIPLAHIEAGLRTNNFLSPFPEEMNRTFVSKIAALNFCPTTQSKLNLINEYVQEDKIIISGNTVIDTLFLSLEKIEKLNIQIEGINRLDVESFKHEKMILITCHRRESYGEGFDSICKSIKKLCLKYSTIKFVFPVHLNPNVQDAVNRNLKGQNLNNLYLIPPQPYLSFVNLMEKSFLILTDSGGIQEEAPSLGKPVLVMRDTTERPEGVSAGTVKLVGTNEISILNEVSNLIDDEEYYKQFAKKNNPYGDGKSATLIIAEICKFLKLTK